MSRGSFGRSVARAAASGGGKAYRPRPAIGWYLSLFLIVIAGVSLIVYSRQERLHPKTKPTEGPTATASWHVALAFDICGKVQPNLPVNTNLSSTGIRTLGDGLIYIVPSASSAKPANFEGAKANLGTFVSNYSKLTLTSTTLKLPTSKSYTNGDSCSSAKGPVTAADKGAMRIEVWSSPTAKGKVLTTADPSSLHFTNGQMITVGFVTPSETLPVPPSRSGLVAVLSTSATTTTTASSTTTTASSTTTTTKP